MADRALVMYAGKIVEYGLTQRTSTIRNIHIPAPITPNLKLPIDLMLSRYFPNLINHQKDFSLRNKYVLEIDFEEEPPFFKVRIHIMRHLVITSRCSKSNLQVRV